MENGYFEKGDIVKLRSGKAPIEVMKIKETSNFTQYIRGRYVSSRKWANEQHDQYSPSLPEWGSWRKSVDFELFDGAVNDTRQVPLKYLYGEWNEEQSMNENLLYQTKGEDPLFGTHIATDSKGRFVLEMKGSGNVLAFDEKDIEVVTPFTVQLDPLLKNDGPQVHVLAEEGQVEKGDVLLEMNSGKLWRVVVVGSKSRSPKSNVSKWLKIPTEAISFGVRPDK